MDYSLIKETASAGIFAVLFTGLLVYVLKQSERRENKLTEALAKWAELYEKLHNEVSGINKCLEALVRRDNRRR